MQDAELCVGDMKVAPDGIDQQSKYLPIGVGKNRGNREDRDGPPALTSGRIGPDAVDGGLHLGRGAFPA